MKGVILHGGHGTRLRPLTHTGPKQLIPVANKPISQYVLEDLRNSGIRDIAIILGDLSPEKVKQYYKNGEEFDVNLTYIQQDRPAGIAHAVGLAENFTKNSPFVAYLGDNLLKGGISKFVKEFQQQNYDTMILLQSGKPPAIRSGPVQRKGKISETYRKAKGTTKQLRTNRNILLHTKNL